MLLCPEGSPRGGGETKRQKIHHDQRSERDSETGRTGSTVEGNAADADAVAFLNKFTSSSLSTVSDGALPSPVTIETPGFNDLIDSEEDDEHRRSSAGVTETVSDQGTGTDSGIDFIRSLTDPRAFMDRTHTSHRTDPGSEGAGMTTCDGEERLSNCDLPPNSQIEEVNNNQRFEGVFKSLMKLLNDCKDKGSGLIGAPGSSSAVPGPSCAPKSHDDYPRVSFDRDARDTLRPVGEIRPFIDVARCVETGVRPRRGGAAGVTRRRGRGSQSRRSGRNTVREQRVTEDTARGRSRRGRRGPVLVEDGLEIVEPPAQLVPSVEEETAMATAMLEDLAEVDLEMF